jgi:hypothetical protein
MNPIFLDRLSVIARTGAERRRVVDQACQKIAGLGEVLRGGSDTFTHDSLL